MENNSRRIQESPILRPNKDNWGMSSYPNNRKHFLRTDHRTILDSLDASQQNTSLGYFLTAVKKPGPKQKKLLLLQVPTSMKFKLDSRILWHI